jgi:hypothetical protein
MRDSIERKRQKEGCDQMFKEILRNRLRLTWDLPEVLSMATDSCSSIEQVGLT